MEEKYCYICNSHVENFSGFILMNMGLHKFKNRHAKHALDFKYSIFRSKITKRKCHVIIKNLKENLKYID
jgi:hypothetical protein